MITIDKEKVKGAMRRALVGAKKGYKETSKFLGHYVPKAHRYTGSVAEGITGAFKVRVPKDPHYIDLTLPRKSTPKMKHSGMKMSLMKGNNRVKMTRMRSKVDWNNLGINY